MVTEIRHRLQRRRPFEQAGARHREHGLAHQQLRIDIGPDAAAVADADIDIVAGEIGELGVGRDAHVDIGMALAEAPESRQQPFGREGGHDADGEGAAAFAHAQPPRRLAQALEAVAHRLQIGLSGVGQHQAAVDTAEEGGAQPFLQGLDLMADGAVGHVQFGRRLGEAQMLGGDVEATQGVEGREALGHGPPGADFGGWLCVSFSNETYEKRSFEGKGEFHQVTVMDRGHSRPAPKESNMNQIVTNESTLRPQALQPTRPWTRFVHAVDGGLETMVDTLLTWQRRHKDRMHLMSLDDRLLRDIGISYVEVDHEASKPFWRG